MSSDDSRTTSSSRLSQFGLYRTIDARTEEFLRLSRKRQIRQGCACAAVSTAITVTVVVTVILVYEYTMNLDSNTNQKSRKSNWHGLFNDSAPFDAKYNKAKINIDPTTLKLLPLILKALNHNRHLEKLIEETSTNPSFEKKITTQNSFKKNIFSAIGLGINTNKEQRNVEHKTTPPVVIYKNTFNNLDYFKKIRQNKEYQRVLNYFDKMINHDSPAPFSLEIKDNTEVPKPSTNSPRTTKSTTKPHTSIPLRNSTILNGTTTITPFTKVEVKATKSIRTTSTQSMNNHSILKFHPETTTSAFRPKKSSAKPTEISIKETMITQPTKQSITCKCSKKFIEILSKLVLNIQELTPEIMLYKLACNGVENTSATASPKITTTAISTVPRTVPEAVDEKDIFSIEPSLNHKKTSTNLLQHFKDMHAGIPNSFDSILHPKYKFDIDDEFISDDNTKYTSMKSHIEPTLKSQAIFDTSTEPMKKSTNFWPYSFDEKDRTSRVTTQTPHVKTILPFFDDDFDIEDYFDDKDQPDSKGINEQTSKPKSYSRNRDNLLEKSKKAKILPHSDDEINQPITFLNLANLVNTFKDTNEVKVSTSTTTQPTRQQMKNSDLFSSVKSKNKKEKTDLKDKKLFPSSKEAIKISGVTSKPKNENNSNKSSEFKRKGLSGTKEIKIESKGGPSKLLHDYDKIIMTIPGIRMNLTKINKTNKVEVTTIPKLAVTEVQNLSLAHGGSRSIMNLTSSRTLPYKIPNTYLAINAENLTSVFNKTSRKVLYSSIINELENKSLELNHNKIQESTTHFVLDYDEFRFLSDDVQEKEAQEYDNFKASKYDKYDYAGQRADKMGDTSKFLKSMLPISRPTYLEIQRNDWKHDTDYGNMDNIFESP